MTITLRAGVLNSGIQQNGTEFLTVDTSNNVGIGTTSPAAKLDVVGNIKAGTGFFIGTTGTSGYVALSTGTSVMGEGASLVCRNTSSTYNPSGIEIYAGGAEQARIDSAGLFKFNSGYGSAATAYGCRAWVNFNGLGTVAIRASGNVSSITDNGVGDYTVNLTTALVDANYAAPFSGSRSTSAGASAMCNVTSLTTTTFKVYTTNDLGTLADAEQVQLAVFR